MSTVYKSCSLLKFFVFNGDKFGRTEETEEEKVIYFWPTDTTTDERMNDIGLCEALITFSSEFAQTPPTSCRTERTIYMFIQPEKGWWIIMVLQNPRLIVTSQDKSGSEVKTTWKPDDLDEKALLTHLRRIYVQFKLFNGPFEYILKHNPENFRDVITNGFKIIDKYKSDLEKNDILSSLDGIHFFPVDKNVYLRIQSVINDTENTFDNILYSSFMYKHYLVWSGLEQEEMRGIYRYIEESYKESQNSGKLTVLTPQIFLGPENMCCYLILFQLNDCSFALIVEKKNEMANGLPPTFIEPLSKLMQTHIALISSIISAHAKKISYDEGFRYLYFNHMNLALKSTLDRDTLTPDTIRILNKMHNDFENNSQLSEILISNEGWIVGRKSDQREFYIIFDEKSATHLLEINEEVKKLCATYFRDIFID